jgi:hypothetical protein
VEAILVEFRGEEDFFLQSLCEKYCLSHADVQSILYDSRYENTKEETSEVIDSRNENLTEKDTFSSHHDKADMNSSRFYYNDTYGSSTTGNTDYGSIISSFATPTVKVKRASQTSTFSSISEISERHRHSNQYQGRNEELMGRKDSIQRHSRIDTSSDARHSQCVSAPQNTGNRNKDIPLSDRKVLGAERGNRREREVNSRAGEMRPRDSRLALCDSGTDDTTKSSCHSRGEEACEEEKSDWIEMYDDANKRLYYYNSQERYNSWIPPHSFQALRRSAYGSPSASVVSTPATTPSLPGYPQGSDSSKQRRDSNGYTYESSFAPTIVTLQTVEMSLEKTESVSSIDGHSMSRSSERRKLRAHVKEERRLQMKERRDYFMAKDLIQNPFPNDALEGQGQGRRCVVSSSSRIEGNQGQGPGQGQAQGQGERCVVPSSSRIDDNQGLDQGQGQGERCVVSSSSRIEENQGPGQGQAQGPGQGQAQGQGQGKRYVVSSSSHIDDNQGPGQGQGQGQGKHYVVPSSSRIDDNQGPGQGQGQGRRCVVPSSSRIEENQGQGPGQGQGLRYVVPSSSSIEENQGQGQGQGRGKRYVVPSSSRIYDNQGPGQGQGRGERCVVPTSSGVVEGQDRGHGQGQGKRSEMPSSSRIEEGPRQSPGQGQGEGQGQGKRCVVPSSSGIEENQGQGRGQNQGQGQNQGKRYVVPSSSGIEENQGQGPGQGQGERCVVPSTTGIEENQGQGSGQGQGQGQGKHYVVPLSSSGIEEGPHQGAGQGQGQGMRYVVPSSTSGIEEGPHQGAGQGQGQGQGMRYVVPSSSGVVEGQGAGQGQGQGQSQGQGKRCVVPSSSGIEENQGQGRGQNQGQGKQYEVPSSPALKVLRDEEMPLSAGKCIKGLTGLSPCYCY